MAMLRLSAVRRIVQEVEREPDVSRRVLARRVGLTESSARWHLRRLKAAGALEVVPDVQSGREVFRVGEQVRDLLAARGRHVEPRTNPLGRA
jgi:DNA-binding transcriptional ArsR family regulator